MKRVKSSIIVLIQCALLLGACGPNAEQSAATSTRRRKQRFRRPRCLPIPWSPPIPPRRCPPIPLRPSQPTHPPLCRRKHPCRRTRPPSHPHPAHSPSSMTSPSTVGAGQTASCASGRMVGCWWDHSRRLPTSINIPAPAAVRAPIIRLPSMPILSMVRSTASLGYSSAMQRVNNTILAFLPGSITLSASTSTREIPGTCSIFSGAVWSKPAMPLITSRYRSGPQCSPTRQITSFP